MKRIFHPAAGIGLSSTSAPGWGISPCAQPGGIRPENRRVRTVPESFRLLQENLRLNGIRNVQAFPLAVGARSGPMQLQTTTGVAVQHSTASSGVIDPCGLAPGRGSHSRTTRSKRPASRTAIC